MISKERLEELIKQGATIWDCEVCEIRLVEDSKHIVNLHDNYLYIADYLTNIAQTSSWWEDCTMGFDDLFETKEEAEWCKEFSCIKRTDKLELPEWNSFDNTITLFTSKAGRMCMIQAFIKKESNLGYIEVVEGNRIVFSSNQYTKEEYIKACRHAKSLFLGVNSEK